MKKILLISLILIFCMSCVSLFGPRGRGIRVRPKGIRVRSYEVGNTESFEMESQDTILY